MEIFLLIGCSVFITSAKMAPPYMIDLRQVVKTFKSDPEKYSKVAEDEVKRQAQ